LYPARNRQEYPGLAGDTTIQSGSIDMTSTVLLSAEVNQKSPQGGAFLVRRARDFIARLVQIGPTDESVPTVATSKGPFSPVLVYDLLADYPELRLAMLRATPVLERAASITEILHALREGHLPHPGALRSALKQKLMNPYRLNEAAAYFDFLYGALQLMVLHHGTRDSPQYEELFQLAASQIYSLVSIGKSDLSYHVEHFLAHAAIYAAMQDSSDLWSSVVQEASVLIESWGMTAPPEGVFVHCALNFEMHCRRMPTSDLPYDLIKFLRHRVRDKQITIAEAYEVMTLTLGWRLASGLLRLLWPDAAHDYSMYERERITKLSKENADGTWAIAAKRGYCSGLGIPYVRTSRPLTPANEFGLSFPGGWTIGGTSIICKAGNFRILLDCGATALGADRFSDPDLELLDTVAVSHAHQDHIGGLLELFRRGYAGNWYGTRQTGILGRLTLQDSIKLHRALYGCEAIYDDVLLETVMGKFIPVDYGIEIDLDEEVSIKPFPAGHVPGSCQWQIRHHEKRFVFSGDFNLRANLSDATRALEYPSQEEIDSTIGIVVEGTYAFSAERILDNFEARESLIEEILKCTSRPVLVPVLSLGRAQEVCAALSATDLRVGVFGLAARMTRAVSRLLAANVVFDDRPPAAIKPGDYDVLVASSGCLQGGPSKIFYEKPNFKGMPVILTGHIFPGTPAKAIMDHVPRVRFSAHAAAEDWQAYMDRFGKAQKFVIHLPAWPNPSILNGTDIPHRHSEYLLKQPSEEVTAL
jgi:Metallo-beta-lactamase superfamily domain